MTDAEKNQSALLQRYQDESALLHRIMEDPSKSNDSRVAQAIVVGQCWKAFLAEFLPDNHPDRFARFAKLNDELTYAVSDAVAVLSALICSEFLDHPDDVTNLPHANRLVSIAADRLSNALKVFDHA